MNPRYIKDSIIHFKKTDNQKNMRKNFVGFKVIAVFSYIDKIIIFKYSFSFGYLSVQEFVSNKDVSTVKDAWQLSAQTKPIMEREFQYSGLGEDDMSISDYFISDNRLEKFPIFRTIGIKTYEKMEMYDELFKTDTSNNV